MRYDCSNWDGYIFARLIPNQHLTLFFFIAEEGSTTGRMNSSAGSISSEGDSTMKMSFSNGCWDSTVQTAHVSPSDVMTQGSGPAHFTSPAGMSRAFPCPI